MNESHLKSAMISSFGAFLNLLLILSISDSPTSRWTRRRRITMPRLYMSISQSIAIKPAYDDEHAKLEQVMMAQGRTGSELKFA